MLYCDLADVNTSWSLFWIADYNSSDQKTACRKHELYVSFRELGWQVKMKNICIMGIPNLILMEAHFATE